MFGDCACGPNIKLATRSVCAPISVARAAVRFSASEWPVATCYFRTNLRVVFTVGLEAESDDA